MSRKNQKHQKNRRSRAEHSPGDPTLAATKSLVELPKLENTSAPADPHLHRSFSVREAQHFLSSVGGELTNRDVILEGLWAMVAAATLAWAILVGQATVWHLLVPMAAEYLAYLLALPLFQLYFRHPAVRVPAWQCLGWIIGLVVLLTAGVSYRAESTGAEVLSQGLQDARTAYAWIVGAHIHWPILVAVIHMIRNLLGSFQHLVRKGPPFMGPGMGCAARLAVLLLAAIIIPAVGMFGLGIVQALIPDVPPTLMPWLVWVLWGCLLTSDVFLIWLRSDLQKRLKAKGYQVDS